MCYPSSCLKRSPPFTSHTVKSTQQCFPFLLCNFPHMTGTVVISIYFCAITYPIRKGKENSPWPHPQHLKDPIALLHIVAKIKVQFIFSEFNYFLFSIRSFLFWVYSWQAMELAFSRSPNDLHIVKSNSKFSVFDRIQCSQPLFPPLINVFTWPSRHSLGFPHCSVLLSLSFPAGSSSSSLILHTGMPQAQSLVPDLSLCTYVQWLNSAHGFKYQPYDNGFQIYVCSPSVWPDIHTYIIQLATWHLYLDVW